MDQADVTIVGRLVRDPIIRGEDNARRALFTVAVNRGRDEKKKATFIDCIAWGKRANLLEGVTKGTTVLVMGYLETDKYEKEVDGEKKQFSKLQTNVTTFMVGQPRRYDTDTSSEETVEVGVGGADEDVPF